MINTAPTPPEGVPDTSTVASQGGTKHPRELSFIGTRGLDTNTELRPSRTEPGPAASQLAASIPRPGTLFILYAPGDCFPLL